LYVNPKGMGTKKIKPNLTCVDQLVNDPSGFSYVAHFSWQNLNSTTVFVPIGPDNLITALGSYSGTQPQLFPVGSGNFDIYFDGAKLTWTVTSYQGNQKTSAASDASSTSSKCHNRVDGATTDESGKYAVQLYPNPTSDLLTIETDQDISTSDVSVMVFDVLGTRYISQSFPDGVNDAIKLDLGNLGAGLYFMKLTIDGTDHVMPVVKE